MAPSDELLLSVRTELMSVLQARARSAVDRGKLNQCEQPVLVLKCMIGPAG